MQKELLFVGLAIVFGVLLRLIFSAWPKSKLWDGLGIVSKIQTQKGRWWPTYIIPDAVNHSGVFPRPALFHFIISKFPGKWWRLVSIILNLSFDIAIGLMIYLLLKFGVKVRMSPLNWMLALAVFYSAPILLPVTARMKSTNNRSLGLFFGTVYFISLYLALNYDYRWIVILTFAYYLVIVGSTFAFQAVIFITTIFSIITLDYRPVVWLSVETVLLYFVKPTMVKAILLFKINHVRQYLKERKYSFSTVHRNLLPNFLKVINPFTWSRTSRNIQLFLYDSPLMIALYSVPLLFVLLSIRRMDLFVDDTPMLSSYLLTLCVSGTIIFVITSIGKGKTFGESERYFEFVWPFAFAYACVYGITSEYWAVILIVHLCVLLLIHFLSIQDAFAQLLFFPNYNSNIGKILDSITSLNPDAKIATIPIRYSRMLSSLNVGRNNNLRFYYQMIVSDEKKYRFSNFEEEVMLKNFFKITPVELHEKYGIEYMVVDHSLLESQLPSYQKHLDNAKILEKFGELVIYKISD